VGEDKREHHHTDECLSSIHAEPTIVGEREHKGQNVLEQAKAEEPRGHRSGYVEYLRAFDKTRRDPFAEYSIPIGARCGAG
jgi:hypothetical protein